MKAVRLLFLCTYVAIGTLPLVWLVLTSVKSRDASISTSARVLPQWGAGEPGAHAFRPTVSGYRSLARPFAGTPHSFFHILGNSLIIGLASTLASVLLGTACAYGFSRYRVPGSSDWLFFILSTRFLPPMAVVVPVLLLFRQLQLDNTRLGLVILYTAFDLSLAVWLMKGFIDDIPRAYEEAAQVDGYGAWAIFGRIILPQCGTGMAVTAVFCLISAWNEYGFALTLCPQDDVKTVPVYFAGLQGNIHGLPWDQVAAGALLYVVPIVVFTVLLRHHLLRGLTFGTIKQ